VKLLYLYPAVYLFEGFSASSISITGIPSLTGYFNPQPVHINFSFLVSYSRSPLHDGHASISRSFVSIMLYPG
jgi:hypothetical protein